MPPITDARRTQILNAAGELLAIQPTASLAEIAEYAKVGKATLHRYFAGRDDLMIALGLRALVTIGEAIADADLDNGPVIDALMRLIDRIVPLGDKLYFLLNEPILDTHPEFLEADRITQVPLARLIARGQQSGELRADLPVDWILHHLNYSLYAAWSSVQAGYTARRDAPRLLMTTIVGGIGVRGHPTR